MRFGKHSTCDLSLKPELVLVERGLTWPPGAKAWSIGVDKQLKLDASAHRLISYKVYVLSRAGAWLQCEP